MVVVCVVTRLHRLLVYGIKCLNKPFLFDQNLIKEKHLLNPKHNGVCTCEKVNEMTNLQISQHACFPSCEKENDVHKVDFT